MNKQISYHLLLCAAPQKQSCCNPSEGIKSWNKLKHILHSLNLEDPTRPEGMVLRSKVDCLRVCHSGPILLIWPEGIWYKEVSPERIEKIITEHILKGKPITQWILKETPLTHSAKNSTCNLKKPTINY